MRLFPNRTYKSGTIWCLWRWTDVPTGYIVRLHLVKTPWFAICLHWLNLPDPEPYLHDHPVSFLSLILRGGYTEQRFGYLYENESPGLNFPIQRSKHLNSFYRNWFNFVKATDPHSITMVKPNTLTLCLMGPKVREWGYHISDGNWTYWKTYNKKKYKKTKKS